MGRKQLIGWTVLGILLGYGAPGWAGKAAPVVSHFEQTGAKEGHATRFTAHGPPMTEFLHFAAVVGDCPLIQLVDDSSTFSQREWTMESCEDLYNLARTMKKTQVDVHGSIAVVRPQTLKPDEKAADAFQGPTLAKGIRLRHVHMDLDMILRILYDSAGNRRYSFTSGLADKTDVTLNLPGQTLEEIFKALAPYARLKPHEPNPEYWSAPLDGGKTPSKILADATLRFFQQDQAVVLAIAERLDGKTIEAPPADEDGKQEGDEEIAASSAHRFALLYGGEGQSYLITNRDVFKDRKTNQLMKTIRVEPHQVTGKIGEETVVLPF